MTLPPRLDAPVLIDLQGVEKTYQTVDGPLTSLRAVSFDVREGEFLSIVGPSGCGKSTLLKILAGLLPQSGGEARIDGRRVEGPQDGVGMVFQSPVLLAWRDVLSNIMLQVEIRGLKWEPYRRRALDLLQIVGLAGFEPEARLGAVWRHAAAGGHLPRPDPRPESPPHGRALWSPGCHDPGNDRPRLQRISAGNEEAVLFVTHSIPEAVFLSDRVLVMTERPGTVEKIYDIPLPRPRSLHNMGTPNFSALAQAIRGHFFAQGIVDH